MAENDLPQNFSGLIPDPMDLQEFGGFTPVQSSPSLVDRKKAELSEASSLKKALFGNPQEQMQVATMLQQGLGGAAEDQGLQDLAMLNPVQFAERYGAEAEAARVGFYKAQSQMRQNKTSTRDAGERTGDALLDAMIAGTNFVGGAASAAMTAKDVLEASPSKVINSAAEMLGIDARVPQPRPSSPLVSETLEKVTDVLRGKQSDKMTRRREQHALEGELMGQESDALYEKEIAEAVGNEDAGFWSKTLSPWLKKTGRDFSGAVKNYGDDPAMALSLIPEAVGSIVPAAASIQVAARARALTGLMKAGMSREAATAALKTKEGRDILTSAAERIAPLVVGITEAGSTVSQTQQELLSLDDNEIAKLPGYYEARKDGASHEQARMQVIRDAGAVAGAVAVPGAILAGKVSAPFAASPLTSGSAKGLARNVVSEGIEETLQEANSQVASNIGQRSAGRDVDIDEGLGQAAAEGFLGGVSGAGAMQAPGGAARAAGVFGSSAKEIAKKGKEANLERRDQQLDDASVVGQKAQSKASEVAAAAASAVISAMPETAPRQEPQPRIMSDEVSTKNEPVRQRVAEAAFLDQDEAVEFTEAFPEELGPVEPGQPIDRVRAVSAAGRAIKDTSKPDGDRIYAALFVMDSFDRMRSLPTEEEVSGDEGAAQNLAVLSDSMSTMESTKIRDEAETLIAALSPEQVRDLANFDILKDEKADPAKKAEIAKIATMIGRVNPTALSQEQYDLVLAQKGKSIFGDRIRKPLEAAKSIAKSIMGADTERQKIVEQQEQDFAVLDERTRERFAKRKHKTHDIVRNEIRVQGNSNGLPSLETYRKRITDMVMSGKQEDAQELFDGLLRFARSQNNKLTALKQSREGVQNGAGINNRKSFMSVNAAGEFFEQTPVFLDERMPSSVALAREVLVDAKLVSGLARSLSDAFDLKIQDTDALNIPDLGLSPKPRIKLKTTAPKQESQEKTDDLPSAVGDNPQAVQTGETSRSEENPDGAVRENDGREPAGRGSGGTGVSSVLLEESSGLRRDGVDPRKASDGDESGNPAKESDRAVQDGESVEEALPREQLRDVADRDASAPAANWFDGLKSSLPRSTDGKNPIWDAYTENRTSTNLAVSEDPMVEVYQSLSGEPEVLLKEEQNAARGLIKDNFRKVRDDFNQRMMGLIKKRGWQEKVLSGDLGDVGGYESARPLNLISDIETNDKGELEKVFMDPRVMSAAFMATSEWMTTNAYRMQPSMDRERVAKSFGIKEHEVTPRLMDLVLFGPPEQLVIEEIARSMEKMLGISPSRTAEIGDAQGLMAAVATNMLHSFANNGMVERQTYKIPAPRDEESVVDGGKKPARDMNVVRVSDTARSMKDVQALQTMTTPYSMMLIPEHEPEMLIGSPPKGSSDNQIRNNLSGLSEQAKKAIRTLENSPNYLNEGFASFIADMGGDAFMGMLGYKEITPEFEKQNNTNTVSSQKGKNQSILSGLKKTQDYAKALRARSEADGQDVGSIPVYYRWGVSSVGRLQQSGHVTPQGSKIARELISNTWSTLDLENQDHMDALWLAAAQAFDVSIEKQSHEASINEAQGLVTGSLQDAVKIARDWDADGKKIDGAAFSKIMEQSGVPVSAKAIHAVVTIAKMQNALKNGQTAGFRTSLALEADGKTDGPINAMVHLLTGPIEERQLEVLAKGGLFFTGQETSLNDFIERRKAEGDPNGLDLYNLAASMFEQSFKGMGKDSMATHAMDRFLPDFSMVESEEGTKYSFGRGLMKNPLTVFLYGSGTQGIASKLAGAMLDSLYEMTSDMAGMLDRGEISKWTEYPGIRENTAAFEGLAEMMGGREDLVNLFQNPTTASISSASVNSMVGFINDEFATPMMEAINEATGGLRSNMERLVRVAQVQGAVFKDLFEQSVEEFGVKGAKGKIRLDKMTMEQLEGLFTQAMVMSPTYESPDQSFQISKKESARSSQNVSTSFEGTSKGVAKGIAPSKTSVKILPFLTIGNGDGQMIMNVVNSNMTGVDRALMVFDGVEMPLDQISGLSEGINKSSWDGWMANNVYSQVLDSYQQMLSFLDEDMIDSLSDDAKRDIYRAITGKKGNKVSMELLKGPLQFLETATDQVDARKYAMSQMAAQVDHMAGARKPYANKGKTTATQDPTQFGTLGEKMNTLYREEMARKEKAREEKLAVANQLIENLEYSQDPNTELEKLISKNGAEVPGYENVKAMNGGDLVRMLREQTGADQEQLKTVNALLSSQGAYQDTKYYFGSAEDLTALRNSGITGVTDPASTPIELGLTYVGAKDAPSVAFIANTSPETVIHEMVHARTSRILQDHYDSPESSPRHVQIAVEQLEALMGDVRRIKDTSSLGLMALKYEFDRLEEGTPDRARMMQEFLAYSLSNQDILEKTKKTRSYGMLTKYARKAVRELKRLLGFRTKDIEDTRILSQVRFYTDVVVQDAKPQNGMNLEKARDEQTAQLALKQSFGPDRRVERVEKLFTERLKNVLDEQRNRDLKSSGEKRTATGRHIRMVQELELASNTALMSLGKAGYALDARQKLAFAAVYQTIQSGLLGTGDKGADPGLIGEINTILDHVLTTVQSGDTLGLTTDQVEFLTGSNGLRKTGISRGEGNVVSRSDMLATFVALSQTSPDMRRALEGLAPPKKTKIQWGSVDEMVSNIIQRLGEIMTSLSFRQGPKEANLQERLDVLSDGLGRIREDRRVLSSLAHMTRAVEMANSAVSSRIEKAADKTTDFLSDRAGSANTRVGRVGFSAAAWITSVGSSNAAESRAEAMTSMINAADGMNTLRDLVTDITGATGSSIDLMRLINPARHQVDVMRQDARDGVPKELSILMGRDVTETQWSQMSDVLGRTDLLSLGRSEVEDLVKNPSKVIQKISAVRKELADLGTASEVAAWEAKAKALATYMVTGDVTSKHLLRNANAIANLFGVPGQNPKAAQQAEPVIERLIALYAFEMTPKENQQAIKDLMAFKTEGMSAVIGLLEAMRRNENARVFRTGLRSNQEESALKNGWAGWMPELTQEGSSVVVRDDSESKELIQQGYVRIGDYKGAKEEGYSGSRGYYQSNTAYRTNFRQGVAQTVNETAWGVDVRNGVTMSSRTAGLVTGSDAQIAKKKVYRQGAVDGLPAGEYLLPIIGSSGDVIGYERPLSGERTRAMQRDNHVGRLIGAWAGRMLEEEAAETINKSMIDVLKKQWDEGKTTRSREYVNIADPNQADPIIKDAWDTMGWRMKDYAREVFGEDDTFYVRKDLVKDAIGYRAASVTDPWTGLSRWSPENQKRVREITRMILGNDAASELARHEKFLGEVIGWAKTTIIVRSLVVPAANVASNVLHLSLKGVPITKIVTGTRKKLIETRQYVANIEEAQKLRVRMAAVSGDPKKVKAFEAWIKTLDDANRTMTIWPLIEAGEFSTIVEDLPEAGSLSRGGFMDQIREGVEKLPTWASGTLKNVGMTQDTEIFRTLNRSVQYGDFIAKAVLYDHLMEEEGKTEREVLDVIMEEFVQYNRLPGRGRDFLESSGLLWFFNYKLRIMKVMARTAREKPLTALLMGSAVGPAAEVDSVFSGSLLGSYADGGINYSIGPGMGVDSWKIHPASTILN